jgi:hypothetical protein
VPSATAVSWVGDLGEAVEQVMALVGCSAAGAVSRWTTVGMGQMNREARSSGGVTGLDTHMIARSRACPHSPPAPLTRPSPTRQTSTLPRPWLRQWRLDPALGRSQWPLAPVSRPRPLGAPGRPPRRDRPRPRRRLLGLSLDRRVNASETAGADRSCRNGPGHHLLDPSLCWAWAQATCPFGSTEQAPPGWRPGLALPA